MHTEIASLREIHDRLNGAVDPAPTQRPMNRNGASIHLPKPRTLDSPFTALVHARRSRYDFDPSGELSVDSVGTLLGTALGLGRRIEAYGDREYPLSVAPTAGGLRTRDTFLFATRIAGIRPGIYRYDMADRCSHAHTEVFAAETRCDTPIPRYRNRLVSYEHPETKLFPCPPDASPPVLRAICISAIYEPHYWHGSSLAPLNVVS